MIKMLYWLYWQFLSVILFNCFMGIKEYIEMHFKDILLYISFV